MLSHQAGAAVRLTGGDASLRIVDCDIHERPRAMRDLGRTWSRSSGVTSPKQATCQSFPARIVN